MAQRELIALNHALCDAADELESTVNGEQGVAAMVQSRDDLAAKVGVVPETTHTLCVLRIANIARCALGLCGEAVRFACIHQVRTALYPCPPPAHTCALLQNTSLELQLVDAKKREVQLQRALVDLKSKSDTRVRALQALCG